MLVATGLVWANQDWLLAEDAQMNYVLLLQASDSKSASVVCCKQASTSGLTCDQLCQSAAQLPCKSRAEVEAAFQSQLGQFQEPHGYGLLSLLFSLLLTHGIRYTCYGSILTEWCMIQQAFISHLLLMHSSWQPVTTVDHNDKGHLLMHMWHICSRMLALSYKSPAI